MNLTTAACEMHDLKGALATHIETAKAEENRLRNEIRKRAEVLDLSAQGIDLDKVALAKTIVLVRGTYAKGGDDRASVIADAIKQLATGVPVREHYGDLWRVYFGTKSYDRWYGQRCDREYHYGPRHGSIIFAVEVRGDIRDSRHQSDLSHDEIEAAIYYLANLERVQTAEADARAKAAA